MDDDMGGAAEDAPQSSHARAGREHGFRHRDALRLLFILTAGSEAVKTPPVGAEAATHVFRSEKRVMAIDFLIRYPDYLADALLDEFEASKDASLLETVAAIFDAGEPSLRLVKMVRWNFGAYESIETSLSILNAVGMVRPMKLISEAGARRYDFYLYPKAFQFLDDAVRQVPALLWYRDRVTLAMQIAASKSGSKLKEWQYEHKAYSGTPHGSTIPSIRDEVRQRLDDIRGMHS
jgi:hypothetical protein